MRLPGLRKEEREPIYGELARVLAALHSVDPVALGLGDHGQGGSYIARQVRRWSRQYEASRTETIPSMQALMRYLPEHLSAEGQARIVHGDYRLDDLLFDAEQPRCLAVIDWELSTLGNPLADLAYTCMLYDVALPKIGGLAGVDLESEGIPDEEAFLRAYLSHRVGELDFDPGPFDGSAPIPGWPYFKAFSIFRLAAIAQGVYKRSLKGNASSERAGMFGQVVHFLADAACRILDLPSP